MFLETVVIQQVFFFYSAQIEVIYTVPDPRTITSVISDNGKINPSGAQSITMEMNMN